MIDFKLLLLVIFSSCLPPPVVLYVLAVPPPRLAWCVLSPYQRDPTCWCGAGERYLVWCTAWHTWCGAGQRYLVWCTAWHTWCGAGERYLVWCSAWHTWCGAGERYIEQSVANDGVRLRGLLSPPTHIPCPHPPGLMTLGCMPHRCLPRWQGRAGVWPQPPQRFGL